MAHYNTILHSLSKFLPRHVFGTLEQQFDQSDRRRNSSRYEQFIALLRAQFLGLDSLREIEAALKCKQKKLYHDNINISTDAALFHTRRLQALRCVEAHRHGPQNAAFCFANTRHLFFSFFNQNNFTIR